MEQVSKTSHLEKSLAAAGFRYDHSCRLIFQVKHFSLKNFGKLLILQVQFLPFSMFSVS